MRDRLLTAVLGGFVAGLLVRSLFEFGLLGVFIPLACAAVFLVCAYVSPRRALYVIVVFMCLGVALGIARFDYAERDTMSALSPYVGERVTLVGTISDEPDERELATRLTINVESVDGALARGRILAIVESYPRRHYGERVEVLGKLSEPSSFKTDAGRVFDYPSYLRAKGITHEMYLPTLSSLDASAGNPLFRGLFFLKEAFLSRIAVLIPEPQASLLGGLVVGAKESLGSELLDQFRRVGIVHIVVLSGYNMTIVMNAVTRSLVFLPKPILLSTAAGGVILFALLVGASATVVRASLMALLVIFARATGRTYEAGRALFVVGFLMLLHNPFILLNDLSFQLSFLATIGLIYVSPHLERFFRFVPERLGAREIVTATISTQLIVLPLLLYHSGVFSLASLPVNLLILPVVPLVMLLGFLAGILALVSTLLALPFAWAAWGVLSYILSISALFDSLPGSSFTTGALPLAAMLCWYALYALYFARLHGAHLGHRLLGSR